MALKQLSSLILAAIFFLPTANAEEPRPYIYAYNETRSTDPATDVGSTEVSGVGMEWHGVEKSSFLYAGVSVGEMHSDQIVSAFGDRNYAYPIFVHFGAFMPMKISPFIEYGIEFGAVIFNETIENEEANTDTSSAVGIMIRTKAVLIKAYAKEYQMKPYNLPPVNIYLTGVSVGLEF